MTVNRLTSAKFSKPSLVAVAVVMVFAIAAFFLTHPDTELQSFSPVSGLVALEASAQESMSYPVAMANPQPTLVEFYADWCTTCQGMAPTLQDIHRHIGEQLNFVMLDIDNPQWQAQVEQFHVSGVPHLVLLNSDESVADTFIGKVPKSLLLAHINDLLS